MASRETLVFNIPGLIERPAVGTSCCVTSAEALIAQELWMLPGVLDTEIDAWGGIVTIAYDADLVAPDEITLALTDIGYPPTTPTAG
jgi:hypothetical protein